MVGRLWCDTVPLRICEIRTATWYKGPSMTTDSSSAAQAMRRLASEIGLPNEATKVTRASLLKDLRGLTRDIVGKSSTMTLQQRHHALSCAVLDSMSDGDYRSSVLLMAVGTELSMTWPTDVIQPMVKKVDDQNHLFRHLFWTVVRRSQSSLSAP